ncbi:MAG: hypothetical protein L0226_07865 [Acidobacteria bacterium]|nr:hypothetical protein [Acidobacteriota bacterium]
MKNITNSLVPFAASVLCGACLTVVLGLLMILMTAVGFGSGMPFLYFQRLNLPAISIALPIVGMVLFAAILVGISGQPAEAIKPTVIEGTTLSKEWKKEEHRLKAA